MAAGKKGSGPERTGRTHRQSTRLGGNGPKQTASTKTDDTFSGGVISLDRRTQADRRKGGDRRKVQVPVAVERRKLQRRAKVNRRRQIDPTTCERNYTPDEIEFMNAVDAYKRASGRMFPTCSELLEVLRGLGYEKRRDTSATAVGDSPYPLESCPGAAQDPSGGTTVDPTPTNC